MYKLLVLAALLLVLPIEALAEGTLINTSFYSPTMGQEKSVRIYLPEGYETQGWRRCPVIYYLHGAGILLGHDEFLDVVEALDVMIANGEIKPVIAVCPDGFSSPYPSGFYTSSILYGDLEGYMTEDLITWTDDNFRTIPSWRKRAVMGHSMGGYGALKFYGQHSDLYCCVAAVCGSGLDLPVMLDINLQGVLGELTGPPYIYNPLAGFANGVLFSMAGAFSPNLSNPPYYVDLPIDEDANYIPEVWALWMEHNLPQYLQGLDGNHGGNSPAIYFDAGTLDQFYILPACNAFADSLDLLGIEYEYQVFEGGHFDMLHERFPIALDFLCGYMHHKWGWSDNSLTSPSEELLISVIGYHSSFRGEGYRESIITFDLHSSGYVVLDVYDVSGRKVETLLDNSMNAGLHTVTLDGSSLTDGVYFYSIRTQGEIVTGKILMIQ